MSSVLLYVMQIFKCIIGVYAHEDFQLSVTYTLYTRTSINSVKGGESGPMELLDFFSTPKSFCHQHPDALQPTPVDSKFAIKNL